MKFKRVFGCLCLSVLFSSCGNDGKKEEVTEVRETIEGFDNYRFYLEQFPKAWRIVGSPSQGQFGGVLTLAVEKESKATLSVGLSGEYLGNINRWKKQFGNAEVEQLDDYESLTLFDQEGIIVYEEGKFRGISEDWAMYVAMVKHTEYGLCVLKLTGPANEVKEQKQQVKDAAANLRYWNSNKS